jgi:hypothetical protein
MMLVLGTAAAVSGATLILTRAAARARRGARAGYLDACLPLMQAGQIRITPSGLPRMSGSYRGHAFDVQTVADTLSCRKLPALWLIVTLTEPMQLRAVTDLMLRPRGTETFSNHMTLPCQLDELAGLPEDCALRTDDPAHAAPVRWITRVLDHLGGDRVKEIILSPKGLRIVWLAAEADRARYLLYRDAEMHAAPMDPDELVAILDALAGLCSSVMADAADSARRTG